MVLQNNEGDDRHTTTNRFCHSSDSDSGSLDTTFDTDGIVVNASAAGGNGADYGYSITTDANGRILVTGVSWNGSDVDMVIWKYIP